MSTPALVGTYDRSLDSSKFITKDDLNFLDYRYLGGILETLPGVFIREQFTPGAYNQLNIRGADWRAIAFTANGRLLNDPASGIFNLFHFNTEYADRIEFVSGPRAFLYGVNSSGGAINLITKNYNSNRAFSKINYTEAAYNYQYSDGTFSQNISRKINFTFGFQHQGTDGRYGNSAHTAWNMRVKLRYSLSKDFNIILAQYLTSTETQLNGGIDLNKTGVPALAFDEIQAVVVNADAFEKLSRHDYELSLVGTVLGDSTNVSMYYTTNFREYRDNEAFLPNGVRIDSDHRTSWMGALFTQDYHTTLQRFNMGANIELRQVEGSPNIGRRRNSIGNVWAKEEILFNDALTVAAFGRYDNYLRESSFGLGGDATLKIFDWLSIHAGLSTSKRFPTYQELYWTDSTVSRTGAITSEKHRTAEVGARLRHEGLDLRLVYFHRTVENPILLQPGGSGYVFPGVTFINGGKLISNGIEAKLTWRVWLLHAEGTGMFITQHDEAGTTLFRYPKYSLQGGVYFRQKLLDDNLDLKIGFKGRYVSGSSGERFNPEVLAYVPNTGTSIGFGSSVDGFLIAGIGNAYVHLMWENLTNARYYITPRYPVLDRAIKLGISWQFLD